MNGLVLLLSCIGILGARLCGASLSQNYQNDSSTTSPSTQNDKADPKTVSIILTTTESPRPPSTTPITTTTATSSSTPTATTLYDLIFSKECAPVYMVAGGLILACIILLVSTLLLACKVCQLSRRIKLLSSNSDLISNSEYWMGTAKKNKSKTETEAKETSMLMADVSPAQEEMGNGTAKEDGGKVDTDGQVGKENTEGGDAANGEEAAATPVTVAENSSKPQEEAADSQSTKAVAASSSEDTEEAKDVV